MKRILVLSLSLLISSFYFPAVYAINLELNAIEKSKTKRIQLGGSFGSRATRNSQDTVEAFVENGMITIHFNLNLVAEPVNVLIRDGSGSALFDINYTLNGFEKITIPFYDESVESCEIEISGKVGHLVGII